MKVDKRPIGRYIRLVNQKNKELNISQLLGLSIDKCYIPSVANIIGTDLSTYKIIKKNQFACSLMQVSRDGRIPIACMTEYDQAIMSPAYTIFEIVDENIVLPEYLNMWFMRLEFDREASFLAVGGVRGSLDWNDFCQMEFPLVSIEKQKEIVQAYKIIEDRITLKKKINDNLEATARAIYKSYFVDLEPFGGEQPTDWMEVTINDIAEEVICGKTPPTSEANNYGGTMPFITIPDMHGSVFTTQTERFLSDKGTATQANKTLPENSICVSCIASVGLVCLTAEASQTNQQINSIICKEWVCPYYVYLKMTTLSDYLKQLGAGGSTTLNVNKTLFGQIPILLPKASILAEFHSKVEPLFTSIRANQYEVQSLELLKSLLLTQMLSR